MKFDENGWLDEAIEIDYSSKSMSRQGHKPTFLILHGTAGGTSAEGIGNYFRDSPVQASAHLIIDQTGKVVQGVPLSLAAWGNGVLTPGHAAYFPENVNPNLYTISIEHVKQATDNSNQLTDVQKQKSFEVIAAICSTYGIPRKLADASGGITGHFALDPINRARCPGSFPWDELWAHLKGNNMQVPNGWTDDGHTLTAPNNIPVVRGFRDFVLAHNWNPDNVPLEQEHAEKPLELSNPALGDGTKQTFRWTVLEWSPDRGVFVAETGKEAMLLRILAENAKSPGGVDVTAIMGHVQAILALLSPKP